MDLKSDEESNKSWDENNKITLEEFNMATQGNAMVNKQWIVKAL